MYNRLSHILQTHTKFVEQEKAVDEGRRFEIKSI